MIPTCAHRISSLSRFVLTLVDALMQANHRLDHRPLQRTACIRARACQHPDAKSSPLEPSSEIKIQSFCVMMPNVCFGVQCPASTGPNVAYNCGERSVLGRRISKRPKAMQERPRRTNMHEQTSRNGVRMCVSFKIMNGRACFLSTSSQVCRQRMKVVSQTPNHCHTVNCSARMHHLVPS